MEEAWTARGEWSGLVEWLVSLPNTLDHSRLFPFLCPPVTRYSFPCLRCCSQGVAFTDAGNPFRTPMYVSTVRTGVLGRADHVRAARQPRDNPLTRNFSVYKTPRAFRNPVCSLCRGPFVPQRPNTGDTGGKGKQEKNAQINMKRWLHK